MTDPGAVLAVPAGAALILLAVIDVFVTLFFHAERPALSRVLIRGIWSFCRRLPPPGLLTLAGPVSFLVVVTDWALLLGVGWALVYWPWMPGDFTHATPGDRAGGFIDSLYFSLVTLATLGYGDIAPAAGWLRVLAPLQSLLGLGLLTASVSWLLSIFPVLSRRRALAYEIRLLEAARGEHPSPLPAAVYADLTSRLIASERDLVTFPVTYYFRDDDHRFALAGAIGRLLTLAEEAREQCVSPEVRFHGELLLRAIDDFAASIAERFQLPNGGRAREVLDAYARDHRLDAS
ncbi:hypothetical protein GCM10023321_47510 [Pseudonocardia eucalypti]|uniref:Potassium channel domain-containing protein n=1 Tax=Pseudonocardia eucalypti TaxID=648755 RepID=A0ABP9QI40_9PSEU|nr:hypothetical protein [Pseudonocardia eucalypti]